MDLNTFWHIAANQGFPVLLLGIAVRYFYVRQSDWEKKIEELHEKRNVEREHLIKLTEELQQVIRHNTETLEAIKLILNERDKFRR